MSKADPAHHVKRGQTSYFGPGAMAEAESGGGFLVIQQLPPPHQLRVWGAL